MEEYSISDISSSTVKVSVSNKRRIKIKYFVCVLCALIVLFVITNSLWWNNYNEKYFRHFVKKNSIDISSVDERSSWGYVPYEYNDEMITLEYHKPGRNQYTFGVGLCCNLDNMNTVYFEVPFNNNRYEYEIFGEVGRFGKVTYTVFLDTFYSGSDTSYEQFGFFIAENGKFDYSSDGFPELTQEQRKVIDYLKDDILAMKAEIEKLM